MTTPDIDDLFRRRAPQLEECVRSEVEAPNATIEDACQVAWARLLAERERVRDDTAFAWLRTTATREALLYVAEAHRAGTIEGAEECAAVPNALVDTTLPRRLEARDRLRQLGELPLRQRRLVWLQGLGLSYTEMAAHERCTPRTVERQLTRGRSALRATEAA